MTTPIDFTLKSLNTDFTTISGEMSGDSIKPDTLDASATADIFLPLSHFTGTFKFLTDSDDINDLSNEDIRYIINNRLINDLSDNDLSNVSILGNSFVTTFPITANDSNGVPFEDEKMMVDYDYVRYLASKLFNTHLGVDLFSNEVELRNSIQYIHEPTSGESLLRNKIKDILQAGIDLMRTDGYLQNKSYTDSCGNEVNLSRELMGQIFYADPQRFQDISSASLTDGSGVAIPFIEGDTISFLIRIDAADGQESLTGIDDGNIGTRTYKIRINLYDPLGTSSPTGYKALVPTTPPR
jgi:hypothetical protein